MSPSSASPNSSTSGPASPPPPRAPLPVASVFVIVLTLIVASQPALAPSLLYERAAILRGEYWRLWTGHLVHFGASHLVWNLVVFALAGIWAERLAPARTRLLLALAPGVIGLALLALDPSLATYGGLSGLAAAALAFLAFTQLAHNPSVPSATASTTPTVPAATHASASDRWFWRAVLALILLKIAVEFAADQPLFARFAASGVRSVPLAHLSGFLVASTVHRSRRRRAV